jgi:hypothetical protein
MNRLWLLLAVFTSLAVAPPTLTAQTSIDSSEAGWVDLFDGESLEGWVAHLGTRGDEDSLTLAEIFTVSEGVIQVYPDAPNRSKQYSATLRTKAEFSRFHLQVEYRWRDDRFRPRHAAVRDAGILFHLHTDPTAVWPPCIEMQLGGGEPGAPFVTGDIWVIGNSRAQTRGVIDGTVYAYDPTGPVVQLGGNHPANEGLKGSSYTTIAATRAHGEWNLAEMIVEGSERATYYLNGKLVNEVTDMRFLDADGTWQPLLSGPIALQAEWAELEYRAVRIKEL